MRKRSCQPLLYAALLGLSACVAEEDQLLPSTELVLDGDAGSSRGDAAAPDVSELDGMVSVLPGDPDGGPSDVPPVDAGPELPVQNDVPAGEHCAFVASASSEQIAFEEEVLRLTNAARAVGHNCDANGNFGPTSPLTMEPHLRCSARLHSEWMSETGTFSHDEPGALRTAHDRRRLQLDVRSREHRRGPADARKRGRRVAQERRPLRQHHESQLHRARRGLRKRHADHAGRHLQLSLLDAELWRAL